MNNYKIYVNDRKYSSWTIYDTIQFKEIKEDNFLKLIQKTCFSPVENKMFSNDVFTIDETGKIDIIHSSVRITVSMPGVLIIKDNKTYGRKNGKLLYKCVPDDMRIPPFLVPYEIKTMGFSKVFSNLYVTISFVDWDGTHPHGILNQVIGPVECLDNFYEYQLYCKSLNASIQKFTKDATKKIQNKDHMDLINNIRLKYPCIQERKDVFIFTIDPANSMDLDDGFSIQELENGIQQLSIYISNVTVWLDVLNLWDSFSRRISTIYLPDKKRPMLPTILSDCLCSLQENQYRVAFVMDIFVDNTEIIDIKYSNCLIKVNKNYRYEEWELLNNPKYNQLLNVTKKISNKFKYLNNVRNSHDMVSYLMILMNYYSAKEMLSYKSGIFRSTIMKKEVDVPDFLPEDVGKFIKFWNSACGQYINGNEITSFRHDILEIDSYIHITSPIRRLVDLLNIIKFQENKQLINLSNNAQDFYNKWLNELEYINTTMRSIRKVQCDCSLLDLCSNNPEVMEKEYDGYCFDKLVRNDGLYQFIVFLPELKLSARITMRENLDNFDRRQYKLFLFQEEEKFKRKIRLQLLETK